KFLLSAYSILILLLLPFFEGCVSRQDSSDLRTKTIVFKHGKIAGDPALFMELIDRFEKKNPGIKIKGETLPASTDEQHQFYVINLEGKSPEFDVLSMDVIWVPEFARAGWLRDLSHLLPEDESEEFFPGPMEAVTYRGRLYAIPWYIDAGMLYYRKDLLERYGFSPPETWQELVKIARQITQRESDLYGFIWQGKQYEGLVCNVLEYFWSNHGEVLREGKVVINRPENIEALQLMVDLIYRYHITPPLVLTAIEESTRHLFGSGKALFMRNWPYAWNIFQREGSLVKDKVGISKLPSFPGKTSASTLGGWQLGINRFSKEPEAAERFVKFLTSPEAQKTLALTIGYKPTRKSLYRDKELMEKQPFMARLFEILMKAKPRPVTPYYMMMTQVVQPEFSAALSRIKTPEQALSSAQKQIENIVGVEE
ncbi:MAG: ABC transporter substrate-binding protein, partial [Thermodesulfobacteriota bacterium]